MDWRVTQVCCRPHTPPTTTNTTMPGLAARAQCAMTLQPCVTQHSPGLLVYYCAYPRQQGPSLRASMRGKWLGPRHSAELFLLALYFRPAVLCYFCLGDSALPINTLCSPSHILPGRCRNWLCCAALSSGPSSASSLPITHDNRWPCIWGSGAPMGTNQRWPRAGALPLLGILHFRPLEADASEGTQHLCP